MNRAELERLDRDALIARAEAAGVTRARILTRPELVDELLLRSTSDEATRARARGFFGRARDLLASVVERGLHLPDAAERIRTLGGVLPLRQGAPAALPTVTLAEIYAAQGHRGRAKATLEGVLAREPDHAPARMLLGQLEDANYPVPLPRLPPEPEEAPCVWPPDADAENVSGEDLSGHATRPEGVALDQRAQVDDDALRSGPDDVDECVALPVAPRTLYVSWEVRERTMEYMRAAHPEGAIVLRLVVVVPTWDGPRSSVRDHEAGVATGGHFARELPAGCVVRAAIGWKEGAAFLPIAHSPALETPPGAPSPIMADVLVRWTPRGTLPVDRRDRDAAAIYRALGRVRREIAQTASNG